jgi:hypothetical protein
MGEGQNVPAPTGGFSIPRTEIFQRRPSFWLSFVTVVWTLWVHSQKSQLGRYNEDFSPNYFEYRLLSCVCETGVISKNPRIKNVRITQVGWGGVCMVHTVHAAGEFWCFLLLFSKHRSIHVKSTKWKIWWRGKFEKCLHPLRCRAVGCPGTGVC